MGALSARFIKKTCSHLPLSSFWGYDVSPLDFHPSSDFAFVFSPWHSTSKLGLCSSGLPKTLTSPSFSRHGNARASSALLIWLIENVHFPAFINMTHLLQSNVMVKAVPSARLNVSGSFQYGFFPLFLEQYPISYLMQYLHCMSMGAVICPFCLVWDLSSSALHLADKSEKPVAPVIPCPWRNLFASILSAL